MLPTHDYDLLANEIDMADGQIIVDLKKYTRSQLLRIARGLLNWNCEQVMSDHEHNVHFVTYIKPIHTYLEQ